MIQMKIEEFQKLERIIKNLIKRCKRKDKIIKAQAEQLKKVREFYED